MGMFLYRYMPFLVVVNWCVVYTIYILIHILSFFLTHQWSARLVRDYPSLYLPNIKPPNVPTCVITIWTPFSVFHPSKFLIDVVCFVCIWFILILTKLIQFSFNTWFTERQGRLMRLIKLAAKMICTMHLIVGVSLIE